MTEPRKEILADGIELWLGDCRDVLPLIDRVDAVVTNPPYGIEFGYIGYKDNGGDEYSELISVLSPYPKAVLQYPEEMMRYMVPMWGPPDDSFAWCYNSNTNRQFRLWAFWGISPIWDAVRQPCKNHTDKRVSSYVRSYDWCSDIQQVKNVSIEKTEHPCQVPGELVERIVLLSDKQIICDPFMGSGTTGVACINLGRKFIGIEREPKYYDIARRRITEALRQPRLPLDEPKPMVQTSLLDAAP